MTTSELIAWASAGGALAISLLAWFPWMRANLNHDLFALMVKKLLAAGNAERAQKLCKAAPFAPFVKACDMALFTCADARNDAPSERVRRIREAFDDTLRAELARVGKTAWLAFVAVGLGGVAIYLVVGKGTPPWPLALVGMALLAIGHARQIGLKIAMAAGTHRDALIEAMLASAPST